MVDNNEPEKMDNKTEIPDEDEIIDLLEEVTEPEEDDAIIDLTQTIEDIEEQSEAEEMVDMTEPVEKSEEEIIELDAPIDDGDVEEEEIELTDIVRESPLKGLDVTSSPVFEEVQDEEPPEPLTKKIIEEVYPAGASTATSAEIEIGEPMADDDNEGEGEEDNAFADSLGMDIYDDESEPAVDVDTGDEAETISLTSEQVEAAIERVLLRILPEKIEGILVETIERIVTQEIQRIKNDLLD